jgi:hypothetical protein
VGFGSGLEPERASVAATDGTVTDGFLLPSAATQTGPSRPAGAARPAVIVSTRACSQVAAPIAITGDTFTGLAACS